MNLETTDSYTSKSETHNNKTRLMRKQQVNSGWKESEKKTHTKRKSFLKRTICKTRSLKPDYRGTMTQSLMFIPVIPYRRIYTLLWRNACRLPLRLKHLPPPEARCNPCTEETETPSANCWSAAQRFKYYEWYHQRENSLNPVEGSFCAGWLQRTLCAWFGWLDLAPRLLRSSPGLSWIALDCLNCL